MNITTQPPAQYRRHLTLLAPINATRVTFDEVDAPLVKAGMWGPAVPFRFSGHTLYAPADGIIESFPETGYELSMKTRHGLQLWLSLALHNQNLMGEKCERLCRKGEKVAQGTPLMRIQPHWLKQQNLPLDGALAIKNGHRCQGITFGHGKQLLAKEDVILNIYI